LKACTDQNISIFAEFKDKTEALREFIETELAKRNGIIRAWDMTPR